MSGRKSFLGVYLNTYSVQSEGMEAVFDNLESIGCRAVVITPTVSVSVAEEEGTRIPILHVDGYRRVLGRPIFGRHELHLKSYRAFPPDRSLYGATTYLPRYEKPQAGTNPDLPREIAQEARRRGMGIYTQISPFLVPLLQDNDKPKYPDGTVPRPPQVSTYGSPSSDNVRAFGKALALDVLGYFSDVDGLFLDWAEFGAYDFRDLFAGMDVHTEKMARHFGAEWATVSSGVAALWDRLHHLGENDLLPAETALKRLLDDDRSWIAWNHLKADIVASYYREVRDALNEHGYGSVSLIARGWPPPWNQMSGLAYERLADICSAVTPKLFAFDYCALPRWYGQVLKSWNEKLDEKILLDAIIHWLDMVDDISPRKFDLYHIPYGEEKQPMGVDHYKKRVRKVISKVRKTIPVQPFSHAHMPLEMWKQMVSMLGEESKDGYWIQMYAYLSDAKLEILRRSLCF